MGISQFYISPISEAYNKIKFQTGMTNMADIDTQVHESSRDFILYYENAWYLFTKDLDKKDYAMYNRLGKGAKYTIKEKIKVSFTPLKDMIKMVKKEFRGTAEEIKQKLYNMKAIHSRYANGKLSKYVFTDQKEKIMRE